MRAAPTAGQRIGRVVGISTATGALISLWGVVIGTIAGPSNVFARYHASIWALVAACLLSAPLVGLIVGALLPWVKRPVSAAIVGVLAAVPLVLAIRVATDGMGHWSARDAIVSPVSAVLIGASCGLIAWYMNPSAGSWRLKRRM